VRYRRNFWNVQRANDPAGLLQLEPNMKILDARSTAVFMAAKKFMRIGEYGSIACSLDPDQVQYQNLQVCLCA
jgi:hypothetical protein